MQTCSIVKIKLRVWYCKTAVCMCQLNAEPKNNAALLHIEQNKQTK